VTIIRTRKEVPAASTADLLESYNAYTGKSIKKFSSREAAETQASNAIMSAEDAAGKLGVKKGAKPVAMTLAELDAARAAKAMGADVLSKPTGSAQVATKPEPKGKSLRESLKAKAVGEPNKGKPAPPKKEPGAGRAPKVEWVKLVAGGRSKMQAGSQRKGVYDAIVGAAAKSKSRDADGTTPIVNVEALQEDFHIPIRGHILKLVFEGHIAAVEPAKA
jgi:hypothetical protein